MAKLLLVLVAHELLGQEEQVVLDLVVDARLQRDLEQADLAGDDGLVSADERRLVVRPEEVLAALEARRLRPQVAHPRRVGHGLLLLGEGDLGDAGLVAEVVHEAVEVGVHRWHREQREREELRQDEDGYGCQRQSGRRRRSY